MWVGSGREVGSTGQVKGGLSCRHFSLLPLKCTSWLSCPFAPHKLLKITSTLATWLRSVFPPRRFPSPTHFLEWGVTHLPLIRFLLRVFYYLQMKTDTIGPQGLIPLSVQPRVLSSTNTILPSHTRPPSSPSCLVSLTPLGPAAWRLFLPVSTLQMPPNHSPLQFLFCKWM